MRGPEIRNTHPYQPAAGIWPTEPPCWCQMPRAWRGHADDETPDTPPEAAEIDARRLGETQEQHRMENPS